MRTEDWKLSDKITKKDSELNESRIFSPFFPIEFIQTQPQCPLYVHNNKFVCRNQNEIIISHLRIEHKLRCSAAKIEKSFASD